MSNWARAFGGARVRTALISGTSTGFGPTWQYAFLGNAPTPTYLTLGPPAPIDSGTISTPPAFIPVFISQGDSVDSGSVSPDTIVSYSVWLSQASPIVSGSIYGGTLVGGFSGTHRGDSYVATAPKQQVHPYAPVGFSHLQEGSMYALSVSGTAHVGSSSSVVATGVVDPAMIQGVGVVYRGEARPTGWPIYLGVVRGVRYHEYALGFRYTLLAQSTSLHSRDLGIRYTLGDLGGLVLRERDVGMSYALAAVALAEREVTFTYALVVPTVYERPLSVRYAQGLTEFAIDFNYGVAGSQWMTDLLYHVNTLRASLSLPPVRLYDGSGPDIATQHSDHQAATGIYSHESNAFPSGWNTLADRAGQLTHPYTTISENLAVSAGYGAAYSTPYDIYQLWLGSPIHYANMVMDFGPGADPTMLVGIAFSYVFPIYDGEGNILVNTGVAEHAEYITQVFIDMNVPHWEILMEKELGLTWAQSGALVEEYALSWVQDAYAHVSVRHYSPYALKVANSHEVLWGTRASAAHIAPGHYTTQAAHGAGYVSLSPVRASNSATYSLAQYASVVAAVDSPYSLRVAAALVAQYDQAPKVAVAHGAAYAPYATARAYNVSAYSSLVPVATSHEASVSYLLKVYGNVVSGYADEVRVQYAKKDQYDILSYQPVQRAMVSSYVLASASSVEMVDINAIAYVEMSGRRVPHTFIDISASEDDFVWSGRVGIAELSDYIGIRTDDPITVYLMGQPYNFIVTAKGLGRDAPGDVDMSITCHSPTVALTEPRASLISYTLAAPTLASVLASSLVGQAITWDILDWQIPTAYFAVSNVSPISAAQTIVQAAGGVLETSPSGVLRARYLFPVSVLNWVGAVPDYLLTDIEDNLSYSESIDTTDIINKLRIRNGPDTVSDYLEFTKDDGSEDSGVLRAYVIPWRNADIQDTGGNSIAQSSLQVEVRQEEQLVEFVDGRASLAYPSIGIVSTIWLSDSLGSVLLDTGTRDISTTDITTNYGYGLAQITYVVKCYMCTVQFPVGNAAQFILIDKE